MKEILSDKSLVIVDKYLPISEEDAKKLKTITKGGLNFYLSLLSLISINDYRRKIINLYKQKKRLKLKLITEELLISINGVKVMCEYEELFYKQFYIFDNFKDFEKFYTKITSFNKNQIYPVLFSKYLSIYKFNRGVLLILKTVVWKMKRKKHRVIIYHSPQSFKNELLEFFYDIFVDED